MRFHSLYQALEYSDEYKTRECISKKNLKQILNKSRYEQMTHRI